MSLFTDSSIAGMEMAWKNGYSNLENPDKVIGVKGYEYIEDIERDAKYSSCINTRIQAVVGKGWKIVPHYTNEGGQKKVSSKDQMIADFIRDQLSGIPVFETDIIAFFDHIGKGFSLSEINYKRINKGRWIGKIGLRNIRKRPAKYFSFKFDKYGNFTPIQVDPTRIELDLNKFIHFINGLDDENPYGESVASKCAFWIWLKKNIVKFWAIHAEKYGSPMSKVEIPKNTTPGSAEDIKANEILEALRTASGIKVPKGFDIGLLEATRSGEVGYEAFRKACNDEIATIILGQPLTSGEGTKGFGTHALGSVHAGVLNAYTLFDVIISSAAINMQLIRRLVDYNFDTEHYPSFAWKSFDMSSMITLAQNLHNLVESGLRISAKDIYEKTGLRVPEKDEEVLKIAGKIDSIAAPKGQDNRAKMNADRFSSDEIDALAQQNITFINENEIIVQKYIKFLAGEFSKIAEMLRGLKQFKIEEETATKNQIESLILDELSEVLILADLQGKRHAKQIIGLSNTFADDPEVLYEPFAKIIEQYLLENVVTREEFEQMSQEMRRQAFTIAGEQSTLVLQKVKDAFSDSIKAGGNWVDLVKDINKIFDTSGLTRLKSYHLENVVRTNLQTIYSRAREEIFSQLSETEFPNKTVLAVLDKRTRPSHAKLHMFTKPVSDPIWQTLKTPFDYNCRCAVIRTHKSITVNVTEGAPDLSELGFVK